MSEPVKRELHFRCFMVEFAGVELDIGTTQTRLWGHPLRPTPGAKGAWQVLACWANTTPRAEVTTILERFVPPDSLGMVLEDWCMLEPTATLRGATRRHSEHDLETGE